jgi:hypothetical protein
MRVLRRETVLGAALLPVSISSAGGEDAVGSDSVAEWYFAGWSDFLAGWEWEVLPGNAAGSFLPTLCLLEDALPD